jgi:hypothetical protein
VNFTTQPTPQGEPELERLKRELEELKHAPRGLEGSYRTAAEMERHRHQVRPAIRARALYCMGRLAWKPAASFVYNSSQSARLG